MTTTEYIFSPIASAIYRDTTGAALAALFDAGVPVLDSLEELEDEAALGTPLHLAVFALNPGALQVLLKTGAKHEPDTLGRMPVDLLPDWPIRALNDRGMVACWRDRFDTCRALLDGSYKESKSKAPGKKAPTTEPKSKPVPRRTGRAHKTQKKMQFGKSEAALNA